MSEISPIEKIYSCIENSKNFVLQGGAGSGKTETLKNTLEYISNEHPNKKVACITHTNFAVQEIVNRVGGEYTISTIHSFLNQLIKDYKKNIHEHIHKLFILDPINENKHDDYKKTYNKYAKQYFKLEKESIEKVKGKKDYEKDPDTYNNDLNQKINFLNNKIINIINNKDYKSIEYNDTPYNSFNNLSYGHDGLIDISCILIEEYKILQKIISDKYDYIFVDEYQDTNPNVIKFLINKISSNDKTMIGLFGDSMQTIYDDGIGNVNKYIDENLIAKIEKKDNYRCSQQVINFANKIRYDGLSQELALKKINDKYELEEDRQGKVELIYKMASDTVDKNELSELINTARKDGEVEYTVLKLTNKSIANDLGFKNLYEIFDERYSEPKDEIDKKLSLWQFEELFELLNAYKPFEKNIKPNYNKVLKHLKKNGFNLKTIGDKEEINNNINEILQLNAGAFNVLKKTFETGLLKKSESYENYFEKLQIDKKKYEEDKPHQDFKKIYEDGNNTFNKFTKYTKENNNNFFNGFCVEEFNEKKYDLQKEKFNNKILNDKINFNEIINYYCYQYEYRNIKTMHKTKGGEINNVLIVLDEFKWSKYNFLSIFEKNSEKGKKEKNSNLIYVAATRAKTNLKFVKLMKDTTEEKLIVDYFRDFKITKY